MTFYPAFKKISPELNAAKDYLIFQEVPKGMEGTHQGCLSAFSFGSLISGPPISRRGFFPLFLWNASAKNTPIVLKYFVYGNGLWKCWNDVIPVEMMSNSTVFRCIVLWVLKWKWSFGQSITYLYSLPLVFQETVIWILNLSEIPNLQQ